MFCQSSKLTTANIRQGPSEPVTWDFYKTYFQREQELLNVKEGLTEQVNKQNGNLHNLATQCQSLQQAAQAAKNRCEEYEHAYQESQQTRSSLAFQLQEEKQRHEKTLQAFDFEMKEHAKTERELDRHFFTLNRLSEFLTMVQMATGDKTVVMDGSNKENNLGNLMLELEDKKQYIDNLEDKLKMAKQEYEQRLTGHQEALETRDRAIAELESHTPEQQMMGTPAKKRARADRKTLKVQTAKRER